MASIFNTNVSGPPPGNATAGTSLWIDMGSIPSGLKLWFGSMRLTSPDKSLTFELRTNLTGQNAGTTGATKILYSASVSPRSGTLSVDMYKNGRLHTASVVGTGPEKWWLSLKSKSGTAGSYLYQIFYTTE